MRNALALLALTTSGCMYYAYDQPNPAPAPGPVVVNHAPTVLGGYAGVYWDDYYWDDIWVFEADVDDPDGALDVTAVFADVYDDLTGAQTLHPDSFVMSEGANEASSGRRRQRSSTALWIAAGVVLLVAVVEPLLPSRIGGLEQGEEQALLVGEVMVDQPRGHAGLRRDRPDRGGTDALVEDDSPGRVEDLALALLVIDEFGHGPTIPSTVDRPVDGQSTRSLFYWTSVQ